MEQGEADSNSTSAWCGGRTAGHNSPWVIPGRVAWRGARMGRRMRHGGWWESGHGRQGEWWQVARWGLTSTRSTGGGRRADRPPSRVVPRCVAWSCPGVVAPMLHGGLEGRRQRRGDRRRGRGIKSPWPLVRSLESCQTCSRLTIVTSRPPWRRLQHAPSPCGGPKRAAAILHVPGTTNGRYQPAAPPPPHGFIEFRPALPTQPPPSTTPLGGPQNAERAFNTKETRVSHSRKVF